MNFHDPQHRAVKKILAAGARFFGILAATIATAVFMIIVFTTGEHGAPAAFAQTVAGVSASTAASSSSLQTQLDANNQQMAVLNQQIAQYETELQQVGANKKTLQAAINSLNIQKNKVQTQISLTQTQIKNTQLQIQQLGGQITSAQQTIATDQTALGAYMRTLQKADAKPLIVQMLSSGGLMQTWDDLNQTLQIQNGIQNEIQTLGQQKNQLATTQTASKQKQSTLTAQQQSLTSQQQSLISTEQSKSQLLTETNSQEATYQKLLAAANAELNSFSAFAANAGGSKLLGNQTICDAWGCYYNQRDSAWGADALNGTRYTMASDGCLVTAMAMVITHYGYKNVTPVTINSNPNNFAAYAPAYLLTTINVDGITAARKIVAIDATLATGNPVIVGVDAYGGTHFVVLVSGSRGNYIMKDPYVTDGNNISFASHYSMRSIFAVAKVVVS
jgi:peptidoglycan hydrolase CwlO-like protein